MDRRRAVSSEAIDNDKLFLEKSGILSNLKDLLTKIMENRPKDVVDFMAEYFDCSNDKPDRVSKAYRHIHLVHYSKPAFNTNVRLAYDILSQSKGAGHVKGLSGVLYTELISSLCRSFPTTVKETLLKKLSCRDYEVVPFGIFQSSVFVCVILEDFLKMTDELFTILDSKGANEVDCIVAEVVIQQLKESINKPVDVPQSVMEAGYTLAPDRVYSALASALFRGGTTGSKSREDFITDCAQIFLCKIDVLR